MNRICAIILFLFFLSGCNQQPKPKPVPKGELAFLLQYNNRLPSDVGFLTNHIMERRMANLMKENFKPFRDSLGGENPIFVDTIQHIVMAYFNGKRNNIRHVGFITVDVANDAIWIDYAIGNRAQRYADRTSLSKPSVKLNLPE
ncbi:MAG TPA: hypothetical protein VK174_09995 [Chitinophagales bacterium]|nr:hypothetical protein [Chitinophagales bacterium]